MKNVNVGLIGVGTIGMGVVEGIRDNGGLIAQRTGVSLVLKGICDRDSKVLDGIKDKNIKVRTGNADDLINDPDIDIIVELIGGVNPAKDMILKALNNKKHVVTANKSLLSTHWKEIFKAASDNGVFVNFEASVGGAIPVIRTLRESFVANRIDVIYGILNGTTNFILSKMADSDCPFEEALSIAQKKGIAESDPELDISGKDSAHKLAILSLLGFGKDISLEDIFTEGIKHIGPQDIKFAQKWGYSIKLLAIAKNTDKGVEIRVHPTLLPSSHILSDVNGADNAVFIKADLVEDSLLFGRGAGSRPTAGSVIGDIVDIAKNVAFFGNSNPVPYRLDYADKGSSVIKMEDLSLSYYLRFSVIDKTGVIAGISSILAEKNISIASVSQEERKEGETVPVIILTHMANEGDMTSAVAKIDKMDYVTDKTVVIRMEGQ